MFPAKGLKTEMSIFASKENIGNEHTVTNSLKLTTAYSQFELTFHCNIPNFVAKLANPIQSQFWNLQAGCKHRLL